MTDFMSTSSIRLSWEAIQSPYVIGTALSFIGFLIWIHGALTAQNRATGGKVLSAGPLSPVDVVEQFPDDGEDDSDIRVSKLLIHPIKSFKGTSVNEAEYTPEGFVRDRRFAIMDSETHGVITARQHPKMVLIHPQFVEGRSEDELQLLISFPEDSGYEAFTVPFNPDSSTLRQWQIMNDVKLWASKDIQAHIVSGPASDTLSRFLDRKVQLVYKGRRERFCAPTFAYPKLQASTAFQDGYPLLVASEESRQALEERIRNCAQAEDIEVSKGVEEKWRHNDLKIERFRPNIVVRGAGIPWAEDSWETITFGDNAGRPVPINLVSKCTRCLLPNIDPRTGIRDKAVPFKVLMSFRTGLDPARLKDSCFGCNGVPSDHGVVRVGDRVRVRKYYTE